MATLPKPDCWAPEHARTFNDPEVARVYHLRPPYPDGVFTTLAALMVDQPGTVPWNKAITPNCVGSEGGPRTRR